MLDDLPLKIRVDVLFQRYVHLISKLELREGVPKLELGKQIVSGC